MTDIQQEQRSDHEPKKAWLRTGAGIGGGETGTQEKRLADGGWSLFLAPAHRYDNHLRKRLKLALPGRTFQWQAKQNILAALLISLARVSSDPDKPPTFDERLD